MAAYVYIYIQCHILGVQAGGGSTQNVSFLFEEKLGGGLRESLSPLGKKNHARTTQACVYIYIYIIYSFLFYT